MSKPQLTVDLFKQIAESIFEQFDFKIDDDNREVITLLCQWANEDPIFEQGGKYCLGKGILLMGNPGSGKTKLMEVLQAYFRMYPSDLNFSKTCIWREAREFKIAGDRIFSRFKQGHWFFDELRREKNEEIATHYKNTVDVGRDIIYNAYEAFTGPYQWMSHFTTNQSKSELQITFDDMVNIGNGVEKSRAYSRLTEMCNFIPCVSTQDRREISRPKRKKVFNQPELSDQELQQKSIDAKKDKIELIIEDYNQWVKHEDLHAIRLPNMYYDVLVELNLLDLSATMKTRLMDKAQHNIANLELTRGTNRVYDIKNMLSDIAKNPTHNKIVTLAKQYAIQDYFSIVKADGLDIKKLLNEKIEAHAY